MSGIVDEELGTNDKVKTTKVGESSNTFDFSSWIFGNGKSKKKDIFQLI